MGHCPSTGGTLTYKPTSINPTGSGTLTVYVFNGGVVKFDGPFTTMGANLQVGKDPTGAGSSGYVYFLSSLTGSPAFANSAVLTIQPTGTVELQTNVNVNGVRCTDYGTLILDTGSDIGMATGQTLQVSALNGVAGVLEASGSSSITGDVSVSSSSLYVGAPVALTNPTLNIFGKLTLTNATVSVNVDGASLSNCSTISTTGGTTINSGCTLSVHTFDALATGAHHYQVITGSVSGNFASENWNGGHVWTESADANGVYLDGTI